MSSGGLFWTNFDSPMSFDKRETYESLSREPMNSTSALEDEAIVVALTMCFFFLCGLQTKQISFWFACYELRVLFKVLTLDLFG